MKLIDLYTRRAERAYHRALKELKALQTERKLREDATHDPAPMADPCIMNKHSHLIAEAEALRAEAKAIRDIEAFIAPPAVVENTNRISASNLVRSGHARTLQSDTGSTPNSETENSNPIATTETAAA